MTQRRARIINQGKLIVRKYAYLMTSLLMFLSFPNADLPFMKVFPLWAWVSLAPLFWYVRGKSLKRVYSTSFLAALLGNLLTYWWFAAFGASVPGGEIVVLLFLIPSLSFFFAAKIVLAEYFASRYEKYRFFIYAAFWLIIDYIQSIGFLAFPWTYWGYSQYPFESVIQISSVTGIFGVTFLLIVSNYLIADLLYHYSSIRLILQKEWSLRRMLTFFTPGLIFIVSLLLIVGWGEIRLHLHPVTGKKDMKVAMIQSCISPWDNWSQNRFNFLATLQQLTRKSLEQNPDFIVWSESAMLETLSYDYSRDTLDFFEQQVLGFVSEVDRPFFTGEIGVLVDMKERRRYPQNNGVLINRQGEVVKTYPKIHLCPFGEWFPYEKAFPFIKQLANDMGGSSFQPGKQPEVFTVNGFRFGPLICYEGMFFRLNRVYKQMGIDFLVNITNDGWTDYYAGHLQHFAAAKFRAIENGVWFVRAGNTGYTALIDPYGRVVKSIPILQKSFMTADMDFSLNHETFYTAHGDLFFYVIITLLILMLTFCELIKYYKALQKS